MPICPIFCEERVSLLDYLKKEDSIVFLDETVRTIERGQSTETEFSESMKQRLEKGYILPGQMRELFSCKRNTCPNKSETMCGNGCTGYEV